MDRLKDIIKYLLFATALTPLIVSDKFLYPFVSPRTGFFYLLIEIAFVLFLVILASGYIRKNEIKGNYLLLAFGIFVLVNILSAFFGASLQDSIFGNIERSWGILTLVHVFVFFLLLRSFFEKKDWIKYFKILVWTSVLISIIGILQRFGGVFGVDIFLSGSGRILTTLGNPIYVAIYLLFNIFFAGYLFILRKKEKGSFDFVYLIPVVINLFAFLLTETRGAYLGLIVGIFISSFLYFFFGNSKKTKISLASFLAIIIILISAAFAFPQSKFVQNTPILDRLSTISLSGGSITTRFIGWSAALKGFSDNPILGVGPENYNIVFNKYITPDYYLYGASEPYFDRAHNEFLNILSEIGLVGFLAYLSIIFFIFYLIFKSYRSQKINIEEFMLFSAMAAAYFVHVFFVFNDLNSLMLLVLFMAFIEFTAKEKNIVSFEKEAITQDALKKTLISVVILLVVFVGYEYNYKVLKASNVANDAYLFEENFQINKDVGDFKQAVALYLKSFNEDVVKQKDITFDFVDFLSNSLSSYSLISKDKETLDFLKKGLDEARDKLENELKINKNDALIYIKYSSLNNAYFVVYKDKKYIDKSVFYLKKAISLSPNRPQYYHLLSGVYFLANDAEKSIEAAKFALNMEKDYNKSYFILSRAYLIGGDLDKSLEYLNIAVKMRYEPNQNTLKALAKELLNAKRIQDAISVYEVFLNYYPDSSQILSQIAILYLETERYDDAKTAVKKAAKINPKLQQASNYIIDQINKGNIQQLLDALK